MSLLISRVCFRKDVKRYNRIGTYVVSRGAAHWFPQYKPGPYPKTEEERIKAAQKYNLLPEEYEPYPDDGSGTGDYPKLPHESADMRDPFYPWDNEYLARDYLEPIPRNYPLLQPEFFSAAPGRNITIPRVKGYLTGAILLSFVYYLLRQLETHQPAKERQIWDPNTVHYSFDIEHGTKAPSVKIVEVESPPPGIEFKVSFFPHSLSSKYIRF